MSRALVIVTSSFPIRADGSEAAGSFVADLVEELAKHGDVRVVAPGPKAARERWSEHVEVHRYAAPTRPLSTLKPWRPGDVYWLWRVLRGGLKATRDATADGTTQVLALWGLPCGEWARRATRGGDIGYSVWMLGSDVWSLGRIPVLRGWLARVIRHARHAYADGYQLAADAQRIGGTSVEFLPSTRRIDLADPPPVRSQPPYRLVFLGRWHPNKGIDLLLDALTLLDDADWSHIEAVEIQGGGPMETSVRERVKALQQRGRPIELGHYLAKPEAEAAIARADWLVIPSRIESIPVVFSDAMKLGRPVVASPVGDLPRLLDASPACGMLAAATTPEALRAALHDALHANPSDFAEAVSERARMFELAAIAERLLGAVKSMTDDNANGADPRWGNRHRQRKAQAIWSTVAAVEGVAVGDGLWMDMGCGSGGIAQGLSAHVRHVVGVDPEPWSGWSSMQSTTANLEFRAAACDGASLPAAPGSVDVVVCNQVYEHVADAPQLIRNIASVLRSGGCCYFAGPNLLWPIEPHVFWPFVHWLPRRMAQRLMRLLGSKQAQDLDAFSTHHWRLKRWFRDAGLAWRPAVAARIDSAFEVRGWRARLPRWLAACINGIAPLSPGHIYILRKP